jgi:rare lipoprotein A
MKKLIFYTTTVLFYFTILAMIFSFTSHETKNGTPEIKKEIAPVAAVAANSSPASQGVVSIEDNGDVAQSDYRPLKALPARAIYGTASYYHNKFNGRLTSNGEIFSQQKLTGASNFLPLNEWVRVTNLDNGKAIIVKITDRMHPRMTRVIDLSKTAAKQLSYIGAGLAKVKIEQLGKTKPAA